MRTLLPHQSRAVEAVRAAVAEGKRSILVVSPAGSGKTTIAASIAASAIRKGNRPAWFAHTRELVQQARDTIAEFGFAVGYSAGTYQGAAAGGVAPDGNPVIFDEAHHLEDGNDWSRVAEAYAGKLRIGLTATPERADGSALHGFEVMVVAATYSELLKTGLIVPCRILSTSRGLKGKEILQRPVDAYQAHAAGSIAVVFGSTVAACETFAEDFRAAGVAAEVVHGKLKTADREARLHRWKMGKTRVVCNVGILTEGFDYPAISTVILARSCGSCGLYIQMTARGLRASPGKRETLLLDLAGAAREHGSPTADREYSLEGVGIRLAGAEQGPSFCRTCAQPSEACTCEKDPETGLPVVVGGELEPWKEAMRAEPVSKQAARLARWMREGKEKGHKPAAALFKFRAVFGRFPDATTKAMAMRLGA
jgi:superfamily II DNA or RNA helicase